MKTKVRCIQITFLEVSECVVMEEELVDYLSREINSVPHVLHP